MEKYETIEQLGEGAFAVVIKAKDTNTESIVAIKKLKKKYQTWQECVDLREVKSLNILKKNDNIIKLKEMIRVEDTLHLVFEYMEKNLLELIIGRQLKKFNEGQIRCIIYQTLQGLAYMHKYGFFHRDLKPENLLVCGEVVKIADFGLAREIRSLPPYTDYVSTRYYRAPECILKSTNYNSPIDIWALGCIMIELYNQKPIFIGNSEKEVLFRMCSVLGTPTNTTWSEGIQLAKKIDLKFPTSPGIPLSQIIPDASKDALDFLSVMLRWDPNKRSTASDLLQHPYFSKYPVPNRISTPDYNTTVTGKNVKTFSSVNRNHQQNEMKIKTDELDKNSRKDETDFSRMLNDTKGFNEFLQKIKNEKHEEDLKFIENKNCSPIHKRSHDDEFDFDLPGYFKDNQSIIENKTLYSNKSILNANISNITGLGASQLSSMNGIVANQNGTIYNYNKNFFDTTTLNNINGGSSHGSGSNEQETDNPVVKEGEDLFQNSRRKIITSTNNVNSITGIIENVNSEIIKKEEKNNRHVDEVDNDINSLGSLGSLNNFNIKNKSSGKKELDFDNCNVYLKQNPGSNLDANRPSTRKRSAFNFIENTLDTGAQNLPNSVKSTKDPMNDKMNNFGAQFNNFNINGMKSITNSSNIVANTNNTNAIGSFSFKNQITSTNAINSSPIQDKKTEYQSRRKNQVTNILNELDNPKVVDININSHSSNKNEIDKKDHSIVGFRKNNKDTNFSLMNKEMIVADSSYKKGVSRNNNNFNVTGDTGLAILNSRRHMANSNTLNNQRK